MDKHYTENVIPNISSISNLMFAVFFYESVIFGMIKRREVNTKKNCNLLKEISNSSDVIMLNTNTNIIQSSNDLEKDLPNSSTIKEETPKEEEQEQEKTVSINNDVDMEKTESNENSAKKPLNYKISSNTSSNKISNPVINNFEQKKKRSVKEKKNGKELAIFAVIMEN